MTMQEAVSLAVEKTRLHVKSIGSELREYTACQDGVYVRGDAESFFRLGHIFNWTQSFFTGMSYWAYKITGDDLFLRWNNGFYREYYNKVFETPLETMHDLGFYTHHMRLPCIRRQATGI
uniref:CAZy families GH88 protein n=1 Tax=uncultured Caldicellulosiruptor sp. TaxID=569407 RepID=A0A060CKT8_9FIRM|nr:CAZy families GH88 protein [uncultured Caldicellulosiruptor sp.]